MAHGFLRQAPFFRTRKIVEPRGQFRVLKRPPSTSRAVARTRGFNFKFLSNRWAHEEARRTRFPESAPKRASKVSGIKNGFTRLPLLAAGKITPSTGGRQLFSLAFSHPPSVFEFILPIQQIPPVPFLEWLRVGENLRSNFALKRLAPQPDLNSRPGDSLPTRNNTRKGRNPGGAIFWSWEQ